jgi:hypothetical protein
MPHTVVAPSALVNTKIELSAGKVKKKSPPSLGRAGCFRYTGKTRARAFSRLPISRMSLALLASSAAACSACAGLKPSNALKRPLAGLLISAVCGRRVTRSFIFRYFVISVFRFIASLLYQGQ